MGDPAVPEHNARCPLSLQRVPRLTHLRKEVRCNVILCGWCLSFKEHVLEPQEGIE